MENRSIKILAVDDNADNLLILKTLIKEAFPEALTLAALNGSKGLELAAAHDPDVILLDIVMPDMDGFEVCKKLKADINLHDIPVVFVTALKGDKESRIRALEAGGEAFLAKPIDESELTAQIRAMVKIKTVNLEKRNEKERLAILVAEKTKELKEAHQVTLALLTDLRKEVELRKKNEETMRESSELFSKIFKASPIALTITSVSEGKFTEVNDAWCTLLGFSEEEVIDCGITELKIMDIDSRMRLREEYISKGYIRNIEHDVSTKSGEKKWVLISSELVSIGGNQFSINTTIDITDRKQAESQKEAALEEIRILNEELEKKIDDRTRELRDSQMALLNLVDDLNLSSKNLLSANEALEAVNKELASFSYSVSHDLRAPLRSIDGFSNALLEDCLDKLDDAGKNYLHRIHRATQNMGKLIDDMLNLSRVTQSEFRKERFDLSKMVQEIAAANSEAKPMKGLMVNIQEGIQVIGDQRLMNIGMTNLLDNAWKFAGRKENPHIEFGVTFKDGKKVLFVRDNGVGFDMNYVGKLFGAFQRLHRAEEFPGTGVGLATVLRVINRHGGKIWAQGAVGKGATFYFTLPE